MSQKSTKFLVSAVLLLLAISCVGQVHFAASSQADQNPVDWVAMPLYLLSPFAGSSTPQGYSPSQIRAAYNLPSSGGNGTTIAIVTAYNTPNILDIFNTFSNTFGLPDNSTGNFLVYNMTSNMQSDSSWQMETCLDVEWAHAIAPNATILLVQAANNSLTPLLDAVDYATSQPGVVAVSMSWGGTEFSSEIITKNENHFNKPGIAFFAASGDDGKSVLWPSASASVVSVGGTTLNLRPDGSVASEVAWTGSAGGVSNYVAQPAYQTSYGLTYSMRSVPDVSYNADPATGVSVYNGTWWTIGGTSAGAPQWAAIYSLGLSADNTNLYSKAKSNYSFYFRDITSGANNRYSARAGYDLVTGLGSPLTTNFGTEVTVNPTSGPPNSTIALGGVGFDSASSVNVSYLNPINSIWVPVISNYTLTSSNFSLPVTVPDLLQNSTAGDNPPQFDNIIYQVVDNNTRAFNTTVPYSEMRRGIIQISNQTATGLYGNSTNLASDLFVQNGDSVVLSGNWFNPGNGSVYWDDGSNLGDFSINDTGFFNTTIQIPQTTAGMHRLTILDGAASFCMNLTRLPTVANDYVGGWHTADFTINLTPDYAMNETFYCINNGTTFNVTANGQPQITTEGSNNTLEYWSTWNVYGPTLMELNHTLITGIQLDKTPPSGTITTVSITSTPAITLTVSATDALSGVAQMRFSNDNVTWSSWEAYATQKTWTLTGGNGQKTVYAQFSDNAGLASTAECFVTLSVPQPTPTPTPSPSPTPTQPPSTVTPAETTQPSSSPEPTPTIPEFPVGVIFALFLVTLGLFAFLRRFQHQTDDA